MVEFVRVACIPLMIFFGSMDVVLQKFLYAQTSTLNDGTEHYFKKPWFSSGIIFLAMSCNLILYFIQSTNKEVN